MATTLKREILKKTGGCERSGCDSKTEAQGLNVSALLAKAAAKPGGEHVDESIQRTEKEISGTADAKTVAQIEKNVAKVKRRGEGVAAFKKKNPEFEFSECHRGTGKDFRGFSGFPRLPCGSTISQHSTWRVPGDPILRWRTSGYRDAPPQPESCFQSGGAPNRSCQYARVSQ